jgi:YggT family protein
MPTDLAELIFLILNILSIILIARAICSWFDPTFRSSIGRVLFDITEPLLAPIRQIVPPVGMLDLSILVAFFILFILRTLLESAVYG